MESRFKSSHAHGGAARKDACTRDTQDDTMHFCKNWTDSLGDGDKRKGNQRDGSVARIAERASFFLTATKMIAPPFQATFTSASRPRTEMVGRLVDVFVGSKGT